MTTRTYSPTRSRTKAFVCVCEVHSFYFLGEHTYCNPHMPDLNSSNDDHFDPRAHLQTLTVEQALEYVHNFVDQHCGERDAVYITEIVTAGEKSVDVTYQHALRGSPVAQLVYGAAKLNGTHTEQSVTEGLFWLMRSFNGGNAKAGLMLAVTFMEGDYVPANPAKAYTFASAAAEQGLPAGQYILANLLIGGDGIPEDQERAIALLRAAASAGHAPALKMLQDNDISLE